MASDKKDSGGALGFLKSLLPKKREAEWDDGTDSYNPDSEEARPHLIKMIMTGYGAVAGFFGCQYCKYLHQRFACRAWGIPLTSRPVKSYSVASMVFDIVAVMCVYAILGAVGMLLNKLLQMVFLPGNKDPREAMNTALMWGFIALVVVSIVMLLIPFNVFLIGVD